MTSFDRKLSEWNQQVRSSADLGAQIARRGEPGELDLLVADIRAKLRVTEADGSILDVGCGNGLVLSRISERFSVVCGVDYADGMIEVAQRLVPHAEFAVGQAGALDFADNRFARVLCYSIFHYFPDEAYAHRALRELMRVCAPGGVLLVGDVLDKRFEDEIKGSSSPEHAERLPLIHRYAEWRFYDLERLADHVRALGGRAKILEQPESFRLRRYRKDLRICL